MNHHQTATELLATATALLATAQKLLVIPKAPPTRPKTRRGRPHPDPLTEAQIAEGFAKIRAELEAMP
jgi:hypothetical protein